MDFLRLLLTASAPLALLLNLAAFAPATTPPLSELQQRFDQEHNAVHKAKMLQKLGDAQFDALHAAEKAEDYNAAGVTLEKYRDNVRLVLGALKAQQPDAERNSNGYRQLQMHVHRGVREVEEALFACPEEYKPPLQLVRQDLIAMDDEMLRLLFPKRPEVKPEAKPNSKAEPKPEPRSNANPAARPGAMPYTRPAAKDVQL